MERSLASAAANKPGGARAVSGRAGERLHTHTPNAVIKKPTKYLRGVAGGGPSHHAEREIEAHLPVHNHSDSDGGRRRLVNRSTPAQKSKAPKGKASTLRSGPQEL
ncbi:unnamed protein product, partial [Discosporangium mesarthrocarpum]